MLCLALRNIQQGLARRPGAIDQLLDRIAMRQQRLVERDVRELFGALLTVTALALEELLGAQQVVLRLGQTFSRVGRQVRCVRMRREPGCRRVILGQHTDDTADPFQPCDPLRCRPRHLIALLLLRLQMRAFGLLLLPHLGLQGGVGEALPRIQHGRL